MLASLGFRAIDRNRRLQLLGLSSSPDTQGGGEHVLLTHYKLYQLPCQDLLRPRLFLKSHILE